MGDPILDSMFEGEEFTEEKQQFDGEYGKGKWPDAILREVSSQAATDYGHSVILKVDLKGDNGMPFTFFADAPIVPEEDGNPDTYEEKQKIYNIRLNQLKTLIHATGTWIEFEDKPSPLPPSSSARPPRKVMNTLWPATFRDFSTDEAYNKLVSTFGQLIGSNMPIKVDYRKAATSGKLYKSVWGMPPKV